MEYSLLPLNHGPQNKTPGSTPGANLPMRLHVAVKECPPLRPGDSNNATACQAQGQWTLQRSSYRKSANLRHANPQFPTLTWWATAAVSCARGRHAAQTHSTTLARVQCVNRWLICWIWFAHVVGAWGCCCWFI